MLIRVAGIDVFFRCRDTYEHHEHTCRAPYIPNNLTRFCFFVGEWLIRDAIRFDSKLFAMNPACGTEKVMKWLDEQLSTYAVITELPSTPFGKIRTTYSGKIGTGAKGTCFYHTPSTHRQHTRKCGTWRVGV